MLARTLLYPNDAILSNGLECSMPEIVDVVVVGSGIMGVCLAYELARRTLRVALLEAYALGSGTTGSGFAWLNATSKTESSEPYFRLNAEALRRYETLVLEHKAESLGIHSGGTLYWARNSEAQQVATLRRRAERLQVLGYPYTTVNAHEMEILEPSVRFRRVPNEDVEGLYAPADKWVEPLRLIRFLANYARNHNAAIKEYCPIESFHTDMQGRVSMVRAGGVEYATRSVVLAAGLQTSALIRLLTSNPQSLQSVPIKQIPGVLVDTAPQSAEGQMRRVLYPPDSGGLHFRPTASGGLLVGADDTDAIAHGESLDTKRLSDIGKSLLVRVSDWLPQLSLLETVKGMSTYLCMRPVPQDDHPIVGALPGVKGVYVAVTHSGLTLAPLLAHLLAEEIMLKQIPPQLADYRPDRFLQIPHTSK